MTALTSWSAFTVKNVESGARAAMDWAVMCQAIAVISISEQRYSATSLKASSTSKRKKWCLVKGIALRSRYLRKQPNSGLMECFILHANWTLVTSNFREGLGSHLLVELGDLQSCNSKTCSSLLHLVLSLIIWLKALVNLKVMANLWLVCLWECSNLCMDNLLWEWECSNLCMDNLLWEWGCSNRCMDNLLWEWGCSNRCMGNLILEYH